MTVKEYRDYLSLPEWKLFRKRIIDLSGNYCVKCDRNGTGNNPLEVHHKKYIEGRKPWEYAEDDVMVLCRECHGDLHRKLARCGRQVPVFDEYGNNLSDWFVCPCCGGKGFLPEYEDFCAGECFRCLGSGLAVRMVFDRDDVERQVRTVWEEVQKTGRTDKFPSFENVVDWLLDIHDMN